jgi:hypothetical protein
MELGWFTVRGHKLSRLREIQESSEFRAAFQGLGTGIRGSLHLRMFPLGRSHNDGPRKGPLSLNDSSRLTMRASNLVFRT